MEILGKSETIAACFETSDSLLESLLIGLAYAHYLADSSHLCAELVLCTLELLECPASKLDNNIVAVGNVLVKSSVLAAGNVFECKTAREHCRNESDRETCCL